MVLNGSKILITGGSNGIGKETAKQLKAKGAQILIIGRNESRLKGVASDLDVHYVVADVSKEEDILNTYKTVNEKLGGLDVLINNAGFGEWALVEDLTLESFQKVFNTNVFGAALMAREAAKIFKQQKSGNIINIASTAASKGFKYGSVYAGSKFALSGLTECWRAELRPFNVRVIQINPSEVTTAFGNNGAEKPVDPKKLSSDDIAHTIVAALEMNNKGFITDLTVWATNPF